MPLTSIKYGGVDFPCSEAGTPLPANRPAAITMVNTCSQAALLTLATPADEVVRRPWKLRFIAEMHWLPLIEVLSGCHPRTDPQAHATFMKDLEARAIPRIAHPPTDQLDRVDWAWLLRSGLKPRVPDPTLWQSVLSEGCRSRFKGSQVLFVGDDCVAAAEQARPKCLKATPWLLYKAVTVIGGPLDPAGDSVMTLSWFGEDPSCKAYWHFIKTGTLYCPP